MKRTADYLNEAANSMENCYKMSEEELSKLKGILLKMYLDVKKVCDENNIPVMLSGGTCIGAVRHHGFIPWDEDIDLMMLREDYNRFIELMESELPNEYDFSYPRSGHESIGLMLKIIKRPKQGREMNVAANGGQIILDIFPIERVSDNRFVRRLKFWYLDALRIFVLSSNGLRGHNNKLIDYQTKVLKASLSGRIHYSLRRILGRIVDCIGRQRLIDYYDKLASNSSGNTFRTINTGRGMSQKECLPSNVFFPPCKAEFEGIDSLIPNDADKYLSNLYGNYMQIPPPEKRERHFFSTIDLSLY